MHLRSDRGDEKSEPGKDEKGSHCLCSCELGVPSDTARNAVEGAVEGEVVPAGSPIANAVAGGRHVVI